MGGDTLTVDELIDWFESAKRIGLESGQEIGDYQLLFARNTSFGTVDDARVDHGRNSITLSMNE